MLKIFAASHNPCRSPYSRQYMSGIWYHDDKQHDAIAVMTAAEEKRRGQKLHTEVGPLRQFTAAEDYHQKYYLQSNRLLKKHFRTLYPQLGDFIDSTAAARVNGYLGGNGKREVRDRELNSLGLSEEARLEFAKRTESLE